MRLQYYILLFVLAIIMVGGCKENSSKTDPQKKDVYIKEGKDIVMQAQAALGKKLMTAIQRGGPEYAVSFCSDKALAITDSLGNELGVTLRRVSDKYRNPVNEAEGAELAYIKEAKEQLNKGEVIQPSTIEKPSGMRGYFPIMTNKLCLQCHGNPGEDIQRLTLESIADKYPNDQAIGYAANELRGIWVVEFNNK